MQIELSVRVFPPIGPVEAQISALLSSDSAILGNALFVAKCVDSTVPESYNRQLAQHRKKLDAKESSPAAPNAASTRFRPTAGHAAAIAAILITAASVIRLRAAQNDLWLDEIWSWNLARGISSLGQVFTGIHHDNNHYLNTLYFYILPNRGNWWGYRLVSIFAGIGSVVVAGLIGMRRSTLNAVVLMYLATFSYFLIVYSSEARGYGLMAFFVLLAFLLMDRYLERPSPPAAVAFSLAASLGILAHLTFLPCYAALLAWHAYRSTWRKGLVLSMLSCHALPLLLLGWLYAVDIRYQRVGGGAPDNSALGVFGETISWACGLRGDNAASILGSVAMIGILSALVWSRLRSDRWSLPVLAGIAMPLVFVSISRGNVIYPRYFTVTLVFLLVLIGMEITELFEAGGYRRAAAIGLLCAYLAGNSVYIAQLFSFGRGQYSQAVQYMRENTAGPVVIAGADHPFRIPMTLSFIAPQDGSAKPVRYLNPDQWPADGPQWLILHKESSEDAKPPLEEVTDNAGRHYRFAKGFPSAPLSGLHWFLYLNVTK